MIQTDKCISVTGLGYVGLPLAQALAKNYRVIACDVKTELIEKLRYEYAEATGDEAIYYTTDSQNLRLASAHIVAVPTPHNDATNSPDLTIMEQACVQIGKILKKGDMVVFESTVYPGCTEEICLPILIRESNLNYPDDFSIAYSPERINPGDKINTLHTIIKIVSADRPETLERVKAIYESICENGVKTVSNIKTAESIKLVENIQRDINIAYMNELSEMFRDTEVSFSEVLEGCRTKWNFVSYKPGLVGGHCIAVNPYYLMHFAKKNGREHRLIETARTINKGMAPNIAEYVSKHINKGNVLVVGMAYKANVGDFRNSGGIEIVKKMMNTAGITEVAYTDVFDGERLKKLTDGCKNIELCQIENGSLKGKFDAVIVTTMHDEYRGKCAQAIADLVSENGIVFDVTGEIRNKECVELQKTVKYITL